jgi:Flp pilus assembly protein TadB
MMQLTTQQWFYIGSAMVMLTGLVAVLGGILNWRWVLYNRSLRFFTLFGEKAARIMAVIFGLLTIGAGVYLLLLALGVIPSTLITPTPPAAR